jgi:hypothetical protein
MKRAALVLSLLYPSLAFAASPPTTISVSELVAKTSETTTVGSLAMNVQPLLIGALTVDANDVQRVVYSRGHRTFLSPLPWGLLPAPVPLVPYAGFWVTIGNTSATALTVAPKALTLVSDDASYQPISDSGALYGRFLADVNAARMRYGRPTLDWSFMGEWRELPFMKGNVTIPAHGQWSGYIVFDVGAYTADEYDAFLRRAGNLTVSLTPAQAAPLSIAFSTKQRELPVVCASGIERATFAACVVTGN